MAIQNKVTPFTSAVMLVLMGSSVAKLSSSNTLALSTKSDEADLACTDNGTYWRACYISNHVTSTCQHLKKGNSLSRPEGRILTQDL